MEQGLERVGALRETERHWKILGEREYCGRCRISEVLGLNMAGQTQRDIVGIDNMVSGYGIGSCGGEVIDDEVST
jgi:hypothetical protein